MLLSLRLLCKMPSVTWNWHTGETAFGDLAQGRFDMLEPTTFWLGAGCNGKSKFWHSMMSFRFQNLLLIKPALFFVVLFRKSVKPKTDLFSSPRAEVRVRILNIFLYCCCCSGYNLHGHPHSNNFLVKQPRRMHFITLRKTMWSCQHPGTRTHTRRVLPVWKSKKRHMKTRNKQ